MSELPYYKQQTPFTCSLACLRMVLESKEMKFTEYELSRITSFDIKVGFSPSMIKQICEIINIGCKITFENTIEKLNELVHNNVFPISLLSPAMLYDLTDIEHKHYIVIKDITDENVIINDPDQLYGGEDKKIDIEKFLKAWKKVSNMLIVIGD